MAHTPEPDSGAGALPPEQTLQLALLREIDTVRKSCLARMRDDSPRHGLAPRTLELTAGYRHFVQRLEEME